jgi:hypothetical protein
MENYNIFEMLKKMWSNFQKIVTKLSKLWVWDPGSGKTLSGLRILDPGVKKASDPGSWIRNTDEIVCVCQLMAARAGA